MKVRIVKMTGGGWSAPARYIPEDELILAVGNWLLLGYSVEIQN